MQTNKNEHKIRLSLKSSWG